MPDRLGFDKVAQKFRKFHIQGLIIIGGFEVTTAILQYSLGCASRFIHNVTLWCVVLCCDVVWCDVV